MANVLKMAIIEAIYSLRAAGLSCREIAKCLGIHRETVSRHLRLQHRAGFEAPTGASMAGRASTAAPWLEWMLEQHAKDLSTKRIHQDLVAEFSGSCGVCYDSVRRLRETGPSSRATHGKRQRLRRPYAGELTKATVSKDRG